MNDDSESPEALAQDRLFHATLARMTGGLSPAALTLAFTDWYVHLALAPGKQAELVRKAVRKWARYSLYAAQASRPEPPEPCITPLPQDRRFRAEGWRSWPFNLIYQAFLLQQQWWHNATTGVHGVERHHEQAVSFTVRQLLDMFSPTNYVLTNPEVLEVTLRQGGANLAQGARNWFEDWERRLAGRRQLGTENYVPGEQVAVTPGKVVYRNRLIELIQYSPSTDTVWCEPVLVVPAWIMKYYILDLSPENSLIRYLVERGHTVFAVSWRNPGDSERDLDMEDYRHLGIVDALKVIGAVCPDAPVHAVGYCLGGTLLMIAAAKLARDGDGRLASISLFAAQTDFTEAGELTLFIDAAQLAYLEDMMWEKGYLDTRQMAGAFQLLRSQDLIWSTLVRDYLLGERQPMTDLMAWNADSTRMPFTMHAQYLRRLFLQNQLAEGHYEIEGRPIVLADIRAPIFALGTEGDHVAPWRSVYKVHLQSNASELTFLLTSGGHNAGIVSPPGHPRRHYRLSTRREGERYVDPDTWFATAQVIEGSWWPAWENWLAEHSSERVAPPPMGSPERGYYPIADAPGSYVLQD